ncbi:MAG: ATP-binding protein [Nannocystales bacterium]
MNLRAIERGVDAGASMRFDNALDGVPLPCLRLDDDGSIIKLNPAAGDFLGVGPEQAVPVPISAFLAPGDAAPFAQFLARTNETTLSHRCTFPLRTKLGADRVVQFDASREEGNSTLLSLIDVTDRESALNRLRASEQRMRSLLEGLPDAVFVVDEGVVVHCNPAAFRIAVEHPIGLPFKSLLQHGDVPELDARPNAGARQAERAELAFRAEEGEPRGAETLWMPIEFEGRIAHLCVARDRTEQRRLEANMAHADRLATVGVLAQGVAHELNNPLTFVWMNVRELVTNLADTTPIEGELRAELLESAREAADGSARMARIVSDMQGLARSDEQPVPMDLCAVVERCLVLARAQMRSRVHVHKTLRAVPMVYGDEGRMTQVVLNLLLNAVQALPDRAGNIWVETLCEEGEVTLEVRDDGTGFDPQVRERVFEPFVTTKPVGDGTGLGLFVCHQYVTECGGKLEALDAWEGGARMRVSLRVAREQSPSFTSGPTHVAPARLAPRLLVIDDEPMIRESLARAMSADVELASSAQAALTLLREGQRFDLVLCDLMMPGRGGRWLHAALRREFPELLPTFCVATGGAVEPEDARFLREQNPPLLRKPFSPDDLTAFVETRLDAKYVRNR